VIGAPVGLAAGAEATVEPAGALAEALGPDELADGADDVGAAAFGFDELQPATTRAATANAAVEAVAVLESGRDKRDACNRLCETIESLHEGWVGVSGSGTWLGRRFHKGMVGGLCNRLCNRMP
jgi:hypothetical protein